MYHASGGQGDIFLFFFFFLRLIAPRQSHNQKGISNNEQGMSNVEGKRAYKLHHSLFDIPCSIFKNVFPENYKHEKLGGKFSPENALY
jgi:hypothetical protein